MVMVPVDMYIEQMLLIVGDVSCLHEKIILGHNLIMLIMP